MIIDRQIIDNNGKRNVIELIVINDGRNDNFYIRNTTTKSERFAGNTISKAIQALENLCGAIHPRKKTLLLNAF